MGVNSMTFKQSAALLNALLEMATGEQTLAAVDESEFVSVATTLLQQGYDPLNTAISQLLSRTIYVARTYSPVFPTLMRDSEIWGGIVRKVTMLEGDFEDDLAFTLPDNGAGPDQFAVRKQKAVQFNFYGSSVVEYGATYTEDQLRVALSGSAEFGSFIAAETNKINNKINKKLEAESRATISNAIAAAISNNDSRVIHLFTEYKAATGNTTITIANYLSEAELPAFARWMSARLQGIKRELKNDSVKFHQDIQTYNGAALSHPITRFTTEEYLNVWMLGTFMDQVKANVYSTTFHNDLISMGNYQEVNFWQSDLQPDKIDVIANVLDVDGIGHAETVESDAIVGIMFDDEAVGITLQDEGVKTAYNARGRYYTDWYNWRIRSYNDQTENFIVLMLD